MAAEASFSSRQETQTSQTQSREEEMIGEAANSAEPATKTFDVWAAVGADKELDHARRVLSMHEFHLIFRHA